MKPPHGPTSWPCGRSHLPLCIISTQSWTPRTRIDLKLAIYTPLGRQGDEETGNTQFDLKTARIVGETMPEPFPVSPLTLLTPSPSAT
jgi:hypothetical protein